VCIYIYIYIYIVVTAVWKVCQSYSPGSCLLEAE